MAVVFLKENVPSFTNTSINGEKVFLLGLLQLSVKQKQGSLELSHTGARHLLNFYYLIKNHRVSNS